MVERTELLAPAGNMECLQAAIQNGADAVYFAGQDFGARSYADNFDEAGIFRAVEYCHLHSAAAYITVNTAVFDREFRRLENFIATLAKASIDGVIVQDLGVVRTIRTICPDLPLHGSTQMTVHNLAGVLEAEKIGLRRVVLSRELSFAEIQNIISHCHAEIEIFIHGAMCMSYSGQCLMSSVLGGRSGNRGRCAQPCRLSYAGQAGNQHYLSLKDMSLIAYSRELAGSGIASLKIEGRMKGPAYVASVVRTYRDCLDGLRIPTIEETERLDRVFYRGGLTDGYFTGKTGREMFAFDKPDNPYARLTAENLTPIERKCLLNAAVSIQTGKPVRIDIQNDDFKVRIYGNLPAEPAKQHSLEKEEVCRQLMKTGGTPFVFREMNVTLQEGLFLPVRELNEVRRQALAAVEDKILERYPKWNCRSYSKTDALEKDDFLGYTCVAHTEEQFQVASDFEFSYLYLPVSLLAKNPEKFLPEADRIVILPPAIQKDEELAVFDEQLRNLYQLGYRRLLVENIGGLQYGGQFILHGGHRLNLLNTRALEEGKNVGLATVCLSPELNLAQIRDIKKYLPAEVIVYGHLPLMVTENCILKNTGVCPQLRQNEMKKKTIPCPCEAGTGKLLDRKGMEFPVIRDGNACRSVVLNAYPTYMGDKKEDIKKCGAAYQRLWFTIETAEECRKICRDYLQGIPCGIEEYTRLHFYKGVQ